MKLIKNTLLLLLISITALSMTACATTPTKTAGDGYPGNLKTKDAVPTKLPLSKTANKPTYSVKGQTYHVLKTYKGYQAVGTASWYGTQFNGHKTSTGDKYNMLQMTAASKVLPIPCFAKVTNLQSGKSVIVKVNDRGPFEKGRLLDVSYAAALKLGMVGRGTAKVQISAIDPDTYNQSSRTNRHVRKGQSLYIQAATVRNKAHATALASQLKRELRTPVGVYTSHTGYQVKAGPFYDTQTTDNLVAKMQQDGIAHPTVIG